MIDLMVRIYWEPRDLWIGLYIKKKHPLDIYICPIPAFVIHIRRVKFDPQVPK